MSNDTIVINGQKVVNPLNQEVVTIRGFAPGEYTVNVHYYETKNGEPINVNVSVVKVNPRAEVVYYGTVTLQRKGDEATAVRFAQAAAALKVQRHGGRAGAPTRAEVEKMLGEVSSE